MYMYDLEVIEEEAYLRWKEEVNDEYPGKGNSLFQVPFYPLLFLEWKSGIQFQTLNVLWGI